MARQGPTEAEFTRQVLQLAKLRGFRTAHFRPARTARGWRTPCQGQAKGFPDILFVRHSRLFVAELKVGRGQPTEEQSAWLAAFRAAGVPAYLWRPENWAQIEEVLR